MSTRGAYGFKYNNQTKVIYSFSDSYFNGLGNSIVEFIKKIKISKLKKELKSLSRIDKDKKGSFSNFENWSNHSQVLQNIYVGAYKVYFDASSFLDNELLCEYYYLIDLDNNEFKIYMAGLKFLIQSYPLDSIPSSWLEECKLKAAESDKKRTEFLLKIIPK